MQNQRVFSFVLEFLDESNKSNTKKPYLCEILMNINLEVRNNNLKIEKSLFIRLNNKLKLFFENISYIAKRFRNQEIIIGEQLRFSDMLKYIHFFCFVKDNDRCIYNFRKNFRNIFCEDIMNYIITYLI